MEKFINFKELNVVKTGTSTSDGSAALTLTDSAAVFTQVVLPNAIVWDRATARKYLVTAVTSDTELDITAGVTAKVTAVGATVLTVDTDTFVGGDTYLVYALGADDSEVIMRSADVVDVSNAAADSSIVNLTYGIAGTNVMKIDYAYSSTVGSNSAMRAAIQDAVVASLQTSWPNVTYDFPGLQNVYASGSNATWLGGKEYFFLKIAKS